MKKTLTVLCLLLGILLAVKGLWRQSRDDASTLFKELPVLTGGRVQPMDTLARNSLLILRGKRTWVDAEEHKRPAIDWFMDLTLHHPRANDAAVFRIDHPEVVGMLGADEREQKYFSYNDLRPYLGVVMMEYGRVIKSPEADEAYKNALNKLVQAVGLNHRLREAFVAKPVFSDAGNDYEVLLQLMAKSKDPAIRSGEAKDAQMVWDGLKLFWGQFKTLADQSKVFFLPVKAKDEEGQVVYAWQNLGQGLMRVMEGGEFDPQIEYYSLISDAWKSGDEEQAATYLNQMGSNLYHQMGPILSKVPMEVFFNHYDPFTVSMSLYVLAFLVVAFSWLGWHEELGKTAFQLMVLGFVIHSVGLFMRMYIQDRPPVTNLYSSAVFVGWFAVLACVVMEYFSRLSLATAVANMVGFSSLIIALHLDNGEGTMGMMRAVLDSNFWLSTHVITISIGYSANFLAGFLAIYSIALRLVTGRSDHPLGAVLYRMVYGIICFALLFSFIGTVLGGIWADQSWGRFWGWDPKENGALLIVIWNALILHMRLGRLCGERGIMLLAILGNVVTSWSWFGTNMLNVGLHSYGFMEKGFWWLLAFWGSQLFIIGLAFLPLRKQPQDLPET